MSSITKKIQDAASSVLASTAYVSAVILAGGSGSRVGAGVTKQQITVCGKPLVVHSILAFEQCTLVREIVVVAKEDEIPLYEDWKKKYRLTKLSRVVAGGATRQDSAKNGFDVISEKADYVMIHDGARALVTPKMITDVLTEAVLHGAAIAAARSTDTVKYAEHGKIEQTLDRNCVWLAQTPQAFRDEVYRAAIYTAKARGFVGTDDASLVEEIGYPVYLVDCGHENFKVTYQSDVERAERLLFAREREGQ